MDKHYQRALVLLEQSRFDLAEPELRQALAADPDHEMAHAQLAACLIERNEFVQATDEAREAVRLAPEWPAAHAILAQALTRRNRFDEADDAIQEALRLDPDDADHYSVLASVGLARRDWPAALEAAEEGLAQDPEHVACNNLRAVALTQLGRTEEAGAAVAATLARDPEDPFSHANQGWTCLHEANPQQALEHFREALRLDPTLDYARAGMVEALKARNPIYGLFLRYFLWMARLSGRAQWAFIVGAFLGYHVLRGLGDNNPQWMPWIRPLLIGYIIFVVLTWISSPLFNLLLRLNRYGRYALSVDQTRGSNLVGLIGFPALVCVIWWFLTGHELALDGMIYFGFLLLPSSAIFNCDSGWPRRCMIAYTTVLACLYPGFHLLWDIDQSLAKLCLYGFVWGIMLSGLLANALIMTDVRR